MSSVHYPLSAARSCPLCGGPSPVRAAAVPCYPCFALAIGRPRGGRPSARLLLAAAACFLAAALLVLAAVR